MNDRERRPGAGGALVRIRHNRLSLTRSAKADDEAKPGYPPRNEPLVVERDGRLIRRPLARTETVEAADTHADEPGSAPFGKGTQITIALFVISVMLPLNWNIGPVRLTPYLLMVLVSFVPCFVMWIGRRRTPIIPSDLLMLGFCVWAAIALVLGGGAESPVQTAGVLFLQTFGTYLLARMTIRDAASMRFMIRCVTIALVVLLPFVVFEALTGHNLILQIAKLFGRTPAAVDIGKRLGLHRAQGSFEHPILMGVFCSSIFAPAFYAFRNKRHVVLRWIGAPVAIVCAILSLSTGSLLALNVQLGFMLWVRLLRDVKQRWRILTTMFCAFYVLLDLVTTKSPIHTFVRYATFSAQSSYNRILIWEFGSAEALRHPFFGIGLGDWTRPRYMSPSMDNFWLVQAVRYGIPALAMMLAAIWVILRRAGKMDFQNADLVMLRRGMMFSVVATTISVISVHLWNATYVWFMFVIGACAWLSIPQGKQYR